MQRIAKAISGAGICSRREAEQLILAGSVKIDGVIINSPATLVSFDNKIEVSGKLIKPQQIAKLWIYYKPVGLITTHKDPQGRDTVFENLRDFPRVISVGRLDINSEGLLLLTNNGELARYFELPVNKLERVYKVRAHGDPNNIKFVKFPIVIEGISYNPKSIRLISKSAVNSWFEVTLTEGKNREIRKIFENFNLSVNRLIRVKYGPFSLNDLKSGEYKEQQFSRFKDFIEC